MLIYFMRHGEASTQGDDWERTLTPEGANVVRAEAAVLKTLGINPDAVFCSPLPRAVQTAEIIVETLCPEINYTSREELAPGASLSDLVATIEGLEKDAVVFVVGHEPDLSNIVGQLISPSGARVKLKKGGIARVEVMVPLGPNCGELQWLLEPAVLISS